MKINSENDKIKNIGLLIVHDHADNPLSKSINVNKLDFSLSSLKEIDKYLEKVRKKRLDDEEIKKIILRCGAYLGEVIRKIAPRRFVWISYETAYKVDKSIAALGRDLLTHTVIYDRQEKRFWFPLNKVYKYLKCGKGDNLWSFAVVCLGRKNKKR